MPPQQCPEPTAGPKRSPQQLGSAGRAVLGAAEAQSAAEQARAAAANQPAAASRTAASTTCGPAQAAGVQHVVERMNNW